MPSIYVVSASYASSPHQSPAIDPSGNLSTDFISLARNLSYDANLEVRSGFFAVCVKLPANPPRENHWDCGDASDILARVSGNPDPLGLVQYSGRFSSEVVFYGLM